MTTLLIETQAVADDPATEVITLRILAQAAEWQGLYDRLQVFRAISERGPFVELTHAATSGARVPQYGGDASSVVGAQAAVVGKRLRLRVGAETLEVLFSGAGATLSFAEAASQVVAQGLGKVIGWVDPEGQFVVASTAVGSSAVLEVLGGDAAPLLGLPLIPPGSVGVGLEARIPLLAGVAAYTFRDLRGQRSYFYRTRFLARQSGAQSAYSPSASYRSGVGLPPEALVQGFVSLVDSSGRPLVSRAVQVGMDYDGRVVEGSTVAGGDQLLFTDSEGRASFTLVRGQTYSVAIAGTDLNRQVLAPADTAVMVFNLLDAAYSTGQDMFAVAVPNLIVAERRTL